MFSVLVWLQGPTSSGKTSLVAFLAAQTGHTLVRINNHEQTDLQEYLGSYISNETGKLVFQEGALVQAVRRGHWLLLDELNLAPSQVLEALNRCGPLAHTVLTGSPAVLLTHFHSLSTHWLTCSVADPFTLTQHSLLTSSLADSLTLIHAQDTLTRLLSCLLLQPFIP